LLSGLLNLIPYLGVVLSWIPPILIGIKQFHTPGPFIGIFTILTLFHFIANNLLVPALVGWRVRLNALALTVSLLFFGLLWGAMACCSPSRYRRDQSHLRPHRRAATRRPLAQRLALSARKRSTTSFTAAPSRAS